MNVRETKWSLTSDNPRSNSQVKLTPQTEPDKAHGVKIQIFILDPKNMKQLIGHDSKTLATLHLGVIQQLRGQNFAFF